MSTNPEARAWLRVRADALLENYGRLRASVGSEARLIPMVKADAYGLGMPEVVQTLRGAGPWGWGVATVAEGLRLRALGAEEPIVVFSPLIQEELETALGASLDLSVSSLAALEQVAVAAGRTGEAARVHVDVDTGMGRSGFDWRSADVWIPRLAEAMEGAVEWIGYFTHLHSAEDDEASSREQVARFTEVYEALTNRPPGLMVHVLNSAGSFALPEHARHAIRPGIYLYGGGVGPGRPGPAAVVSLHARVCHLREGGGRHDLGVWRHVPGEPTRRVGDPLGGVRRRFAQGAREPRQSPSRGTERPIIGRISMDLTVVDISDVSGVQVGDIATLLGAEGQEEITLDEVAELAGTISYEILTGFTARLPASGADTS